MMSKVNHILSSGGVKYMLYMKKKVSQLTCTKNINHEVLTPSIYMRLMTLCSVESAWPKIPEYKHYIG